MAYVYRHIRLDKNEPFYIGIGVKANHARAYSKNDRNKHWRNIASNGYDVEILFDGLTWDEACEKEKEFIKLYGRKDLGKGCLVNMTDGGDGGFGVLVSEDTRRKLIIAAVGRKKTIETRRKISEKNKGRVRTEESKKKWREAMKTYVPSAEWRVNMSKARKGRIFSESHRMSMSEVRKGVKLSELHRMSLSEAKKGKVNEKGNAFKGKIEVYKDGVLVGEYMGTVDCAKKLKINRQCISSCLVGKQKTHYGYTFKRIAKEIDK